MDIVRITFSIIAIVGMLVLLIVKPSINIKGKTFQTFWFIPFICALVLICSLAVPFDQLKEFFFAKNTVNPLQILLLFFSMAFISTILDEAGFFAYLASKVVDKAKGNQLKVFVFIYLLTSVLTIFTSNDVILFTFTPFLLYFTKHAKINPLPFLIAEFVAANTWSIFFIIGNPTNVYLGESFHLTFVSYFTHMWLPTLLAGITSFIVMFVMFFKKLKAPFTGDCEIHPIEDQFLLTASLIALGGCLIAMVISSFLDIPLWLISVIAAGALLITSSIYSIAKKDGKHLFNSFKRLPYDLIPFLLSMFIIVLALKNSGVINYFASFMNNTDVIWSYGGLSFIGANLLNNIPMSVFFTEIIKSQSVAANATYASIIGSNIGAIFTPFGALAGIMWMSILKRNDVKFNFLDFVKYGSIIAIPTMAVSLLGLYANF